MNEEEYISEASFILGFIGEIETFNKLASEFLTLLHTLTSISIKERKKKLETDDDWKEFSENYPTQFATLTQYLHGLRISANRIYFRYEILKNEKYKDFDNITEEYNNLFRGEMIKKEELINFLWKINKAYFLLSKDIRDIREKVKRV